MRVVVNYNRLNDASEKLRAEVRDIIEDTSSEIEQQIRNGFADTKLPVRRDVVAGGFRAQIRVGNTRRFYPAFLEYGHRGVPAKPVATPAAEAARPEFNSRMRRILRRL
jgi:hypothetical protein